MPAGGVGLEGRVRDIELVRVRRARGKSGLLLIAAPNPRGPSRMSSAPVTPRSAPSAAKSPVRGAARMERLAHAVRTKGLLAVPRRASRTWRIACAQRSLSRPSMVAVAAAVPKHPRAAGGMPEVVVHDVAERPRRCAWTARSRRSPIPQKRSPSGMPVLCDRQGGADRRCAWMEQRIAIDVGKLDRVGSAPVDQRRGSCAGFSDRRDEDRTAGAYPVAQCGGEQRRWRPETTRVRLPPSSQRRIATPRAAHRGGRSRVRKLLTKSAIWWKDHRFQNCATYCRRIRFALRRRAAGSGRFPEKRCSPALPASRRARHRSPSPQRA